MKSRLIALLLLVAGLLLCFGKTDTAYAASTNRILTTTSMTKTGYLRKNNNAPLNNFTGAANNYKLHRTHWLRDFGNTAWFATKQRTVQQKNGKRYTYYYVTSTNKKAKGWVNKNNLKKNPKSFTNMYNVAKSKLGARYVYGATGPTVFDCSGYTKYVFKKAANKTLPRVAQSQYNSYSKVSRANAKKGDLIFFGNSTGSITHVGIYVGGGKMIDAQDNGVKNEKVYVSWWHAVGYSRPVNFSA